MKIKSWAILLISLNLAGCTSPGAAKYRTLIDNATEKEVNRIILSEVIPSLGKSHGEVISRVSSAFLGTPYQAGTLIGSPDTPEVLVANFNGVDCFTLVDYVEALTRSRNKKAFLRNLARTRYTNSKVNYFHRRHFFSDWFATIPRNARDVTQEISLDAISVEKQLNRKPDGGEYVPGLGVIPRKIHYIPGKAIDQQVLNKLKTGDYVGVYSQLKGLDVSHMGIVIRQDGQVWFRNASSLAANKKVVDTPFMEYMRTKPGIIVLRAD